MQANNESAWIHKSFREKTCIEQEFEIDRLRVWHTISVDQDSWLDLVYSVTWRIARNYAHNGQFFKF